MDSSLGPIRYTIAMSIPSTDQTLTKPTRGFYAATNGNLVCRLVNDTSDTTFTGLLAGNVYPIQIIIVRKASTTTTGLLLY